MAISASYLLKKIIVATFLRLSFQGISAFYLRPIRACSLRTQNFESQWTMLMSITSMIQGRHTRELWKVNRKFKQLRLWATHVNRKWYQIIERFHSRSQHLCKFIGTKVSVCIRKEFTSHRTGLGHQHGPRFLVLGHQYGRRDEMWKHSIHWSTRTNSVWPFSSPEPLGLICNRFVTLVSLPRDQETKGSGDENAVWPVPYACA